LVGAALASVLLLLFAPEWVVGLRGLDDLLTPAERAKQVTEERRSLLALLAAVGAAIGLYYTHLRHQLDRDSSQLSRDSNFTDRYTKAVEQLGHDSPDVQLGGIYALERIALDSVRDRGVISEVLSAFIREHSVRAPSSTAGPNEQHTHEVAPSKGLATAVQAALRVLGRRPRNDSTYPGADLTGADLSGAILAGLNLADAVLAGTNLAGGILAQADLTDAHLRLANLAQAELTEANLAGAFFARADLAGADLRDANLTGGSLTQANLTGADLSGANLSGVDLSHANLTDARLTDAVLIQAHLADADLRGADLTDADLTQANLTDARLAGADLTNVRLTDEQRKAARSMPAGTVPADPGL
jgi:uncharacterized protein YjbI with pentapeptide repeats